MSGPVQPDSGSLAVSHDGLRAWHSTVCAVWCSSCQNPVHSTESGAPLQLAPESRAAWQKRLWEATGVVQRTVWFGHAAVSLRSAGDASFDRELVYFACAECAPEHAPIPASPDALVSCAPDALAALPCDLLHALAVRSKKTSQTDPVNRTLARVASTAHAVAVLALRGQL